MLAKFGVLTPPQAMVGMLKMCKTIALFVWSTRSFTHPRIRRDIRLKSTRAVRQNFNSDINYARSFLCATRCCRADVDDDDDVACVARRSYLNIKICATYARTRKARRVKSTSGTQLVDSESGRARGKFYFN